MAANSSEKKEDEAVAAEEEDEEEALSLCDLPDNSNKEEDCQARIKADSSHHQEAVITEPPQQEEFDFLLWGGPFSKESEMCVADEVFFQGQILPLCCKSLSSGASRRLLPAVTTGFDRSESSKSESVTSEFKSSGSSGSSGSSRSSSIRSQNSSSSNSISSTIASTTNPEMSKPRIRNHHQFHTNPSPKPQLKASANSSRQVSIIGGHHLNRKSSTWDFFRLGVAPAPEIGLQDLKVRCSNNNKNKTCVSRNSSNSSSSSDRKRMSNHGFRQMLRGCKCSVETVPFDIMITKSTKKTESTTTLSTHAMKEKAKQKQRKNAMSRHRTFEWMKELPHAGYGYNDEEEALLLNS